MISGVGGLSVSAYRIPPTRLGFIMRQSHTDLTEHCRWIEGDGGWGNYTPQL